MSDYKEFEEAAARHTEAGKAYDAAERALAVAANELNRAGREASDAWRKYIASRESMMAKE